MPSCSRGRPVADRPPARPPATQSTSRTRPPSAAGSSARRPGRGRRRPSGRRGRPVRAGHVRVSGVCTPRTTSMLGHSPRGPTSRTGPTCRSSRRLCPVGGSPWTSGAGAGDRGAPRTCAWSSRRRKTSRTLRYGLSESSSDSYSWYNRARTPARRSYCLFHGPPRSASCGTTSVCL